MHWNLRIIKKVYPLEERNKAMKRSYQGGLIIGIALFVIMGFCSMVRGSDYLPFEETNVVINDNIAWGDLGSADMTAITEDYYNVSFVFLDSDVSFTIAEIVEILELSVENWRIIVVVDGENVHGEPDNEEDLQKVKNLIEKLKKIKADD